EWEVKTLRALEVAAVVSQAVDAQLLTVKAPDFRDADRRVDAHAAQGTAADIDFQSQVGRRVDRQIDLVLVAHGRLMLEVITSIWFQTPFEVLAIQGGGTPALARHIQLFREH